MSALSKAQLAERINNEIGINKADAKMLVEFYFEEIRQILESGQHVKLSGFGNFI